MQKSPKMQKRWQNTHTIEWFPRQCKNGTFISPVWKWTKEVWEMFLKQSVHILSFRILMKALFNPNQVGGGQICPLVGKTLYISGTNDRTIEGPWRTFFGWNIWFLNSEFPTFLDFRRKYRFFKKYLRASILKVEGCAFGFWSFSSKTKFQF